jgi:AcrR family transcriptional regulator
MSRTPGANGDETRRRIYSAALRLFAQRGFAAVGIRDLAREAGLTAPSLYHYMGTKEDLLVDIMLSTITPLTNAGAELLEALDRPEEQLAALVELHVWVHGGRGTATLITDTELRALSGPQAAHVMKARDRYEDLWRVVVDRGADAGIFDLADARVATIALLELCTGPAHWYRPGGRLSLMELCEVHADLALATVCARRDGTRIRRAGLTLPRPDTRLPLELIGPDVQLASPPVTTSQEGRP